MVSPWSTNAVEITQNMGVNSLKRIEVFELLKSNSKKFDSMLFETYNQLDQEIFKNSIIPSFIFYFRIIGINKICQSI